jgi:hypothetical protein
MTHLAPITDPAMGNLGYEPKELDFYPTPTWVSEAVVPTIKSLRPDITHVWEPACGDGAMSVVLEKHFAEVVSSDIFYYGWREPGNGMTLTDFLAVPDNVHAKGAIITNPPYGDLAEAFIRKALRLTKKNGGLVAMLLRNEYDTAKGRVDLFNKEPYAAELKLTTRPRWIPGSSGAPRHSYVWHIWSHGHTGPALKFYHALGVK